MTELKVICPFQGRERQVRALTAALLILGAHISCAVSASLTDLDRGKSHMFC